MGAIEIKAFVPAKDFEISKQFYIDLGFEVGWVSGGMAYMKSGGSAFLLQDFYVKEHAENFMMHLLVDDVDRWWKHVLAQDLMGRYGVRTQGLQDQAWGMRDFCITDPCGVLWRIGQNTDDEPKG
jgi:uncharacterized glyoxalase superfamily protein PhnB